MRYLRTPITILRFGPQSFGADHRPLAQTPTEIAAMASVQPIDSSLAESDPGYSGPERRKVWTFAELHAADEANGTPADQIEVGGKTWLVWSADPWPAGFLIAAHWTAEIRLIQPLRPEAGTP